MTCEVCKGAGEVYIMLGPDKHIAKCVFCDGWGTVEQQLPTPKPKAFGSINLDSLLKDE